MQMFGGSFFLWANISNYVVSYLHWENEKHGGGFTEPSTDTIFYVDNCLASLNLIGFNIGLYLVVSGKLQPRSLLLLGSVIAIAGLFSASYCIDFVSFILCYGVVGSIGCGLNYMIPLIVGWEHFPESKGLITGIITSAYGGGSFVYGILARAIVNPDNVLPDVDSGTRDLYYFNETVSMRVPSMFRELCLIWVIQIVIGIALIDRPSKETEQEHEVLREVESEALQDDSDITEIKDDIGKNCKIDP